MKSQLKRLTIYISIHAPAKERPARSTRFVLSMDFNPRSCEGATRFEIGDTMVVNGKLHISRPASSSLR